MTSDSSPRGMTAAGSVHGQNLPKSTIQVFAGFLRAENELLGGWELPTQRPGKLPFHSAVLSFDVLGSSISARKNRCSYLASVLKRLTSILALLIVFWV